MHGKPGCWRGLQTPEAAGHKDPILCPLASAVVPFPDHLWMPKSTDNVVCLKKMFFSKQKSENNLLYCGTTKLFCFLALLEATSRSYNPFPWTWLNPEGIMEAFKPCEDNGECWAQLLNPNLQAGSGVHLVFPLSEQLLPFHPGWTQSPQQQPPRDSMVSCFCAELCPWRMLLWQTPEADPHKGPWGL